ncbi:MAG: hypothetical protein ABFS10_05485 [Bacteroidota bacterium]
MNFRRAVYIIGLLFVFSTAGAQINIYAGGNLQGNYSWLRADDHTFKPGFGGGISFVYWEYEYWFLKAGFEYSYKSSSTLRYPDDYEVDIISPGDKINIEYFEQTIGVPLTIYFRPFESGDNALLVTGTLEPMMVVHLKENSDEFGEVIRKGTDVKSRMKTNLGIGVGYQRQLDRYKYLNIYPSFNVDMRSHRPFNSVTLTAELLFGVY